MTVNGIPAHALVPADPNWTVPGHKRLLDFLPFGMGADTAVVLVAPWASWFGVLRQWLWRSSPLAACQVFLGQVGPPAFSWLLPHDSPSPHCLLKVFP